MNRFESVNKPLMWLMALLLAAVVAGCGGGRGTAVIADTTAPTVSSVVPANAATGIPLNASIVAIFSEAMKPSTLTTSTFTLKQGSTVVPGAVTYAGVTATFKPTSALAASTVYIAAITTGVTDLAGNALAVTKTWSFTTGLVADTTPPTVASTVPVNATTGIAINANVTALFSELMDPATIVSPATSFTLTGPAGAVVAGVVTYSGSTATFNPNVDLAISTLYTATLTTAVKDLAGNAMVANKIWTFTTGLAPDTTKPTVLSTVPADLATVAIPTTITATFSELMDPAALNASPAVAFTLAAPGPTNVPGVVTYTTGNTATFAPGSVLVAGTVYTATISTAVMDLAGNTMLAAKTWSFTTAAAAPTLTLTTNAPIVTNPATGTKAMTFVLTLGSAPATPVSVNYATQLTGSAISGTDFVAATGTVNFATGQTVATVSIVVKSDNVALPDQTVKVLFSGTSLAASVTGTGTILAHGTAGNTVALTAGVDIFTPTATSFASVSTANDDTVNTAVPNVLTSADTIATGAGFDLLSITPTINVAYTLADAIFTNVSGIDKIVILTSGTGAQTLTTGASFNAAFDAAGADLQTTSTSGAQTINMSAVTGPATLTSISDASIAGNFITMGAGVTTVTATTTTGPMTINSASAVVATVTVTTTSGAVTVTTGAGADSVTLTTGNTAGNVITTGAGNDTITATAAAATSNGNTITGGLGSDTIDITGNTAPDTIVIADGDSGITVATADSITGFDTTIDKLSMGLQGTSANYVAASGPVANFAAALTAANLTFTGTVRYSFQFVGTGATLVGYLFKDTTGAGTAGEVVVLVGINNTGIAFGNIIP